MFTSIISNARAFFAAIAQLFTRTPKKVDTPANPEEAFWEVQSKIKYPD